MHETLETKGGSESTRKNARRTSPFERIALISAGVMLVATAVIWVTLRVSGYNLSGFTGKAFWPQKPMYDFTLEDQNGVPFHLAAADRPVVLALIYTGCGDECPFISEKLKAARALLGAAASGVDIVPITVDPSDDTQSVRLAYSKALGMNDSWRFLGGTSAQLEPVLNAYRSMYPEVMNMSGRSITTGLDISQINEGAKVLDSFANGVNADHSMMLWLINRAHKVIGVVDTTDTPAEIARDIRYAERG